MRNQSLKKHPSLVLFWEKANKYRVFLDGTRIQTLTSIT